ncbi:hypothetical protein DP939_32655 [Spongiactinospora rosea]|uniref:Uncharacterized protein n=1 Tax=Spongiactinospora rosea TaxID=2248750 RepID=A0A366LSC0_9ACTN|nr:DUF1707 domain-containing protein [Spongiactinospora rosea]RBQ16092.1 hypothetical protein DP939_32655 [Spongiactinospora rosea]
MQNLPERGDRSSQVRASDSNREQVAAMLGEAMATGQLSHDEYSERLDSLYTAKTLGELELLTRDLQPGGRPAPMPAPGGAPFSYAPASDTDQDNVVAVFGGAHRKGNWRVRRRLLCTAIFGGIELDLSEATFESREVELRIFALFGGVEIRVPEGVEVRSEGSGIFGGFDVRGSSHPDPSAPVLTVRGLALFGGVGGRPRKRKNRS